ncbi:MAG: thiamine phosphate synthase [Planctomycetota bacterium]|nr:MAG: thiamine phosphate synthase [Planctomycetota bacterium]
MRPVGDGFRGGGSVGTGHAFSNSKLQLKASRHHGGRRRGTTGKIMAAGESGGLGGQGSTTGIWRAIDASANRAGEALRVLEDVLRFGLDDEHLTRLAKDLRHDLAGVLTRHGLWRRMAARDVIGDVGAGLEAEAALSRSGLADLVAANAARAAQALRSLQECAAVVATEATAEFESLRYRVYTLERAATTAVRASDRLAGVSLCVLVDGGHEAAAFARLMESLVEAGVRMFQVRDKSLPLPLLAERVRTALAIVRRGGEAGRPIVVVNDRVDVAAALTADGAHVGADDLPVPLTRRVVGPERLVGRTAHTVAEAHSAVVDGADYLGIGPCFTSPTKSFAEHAPPEFLRTVCGEVSLPTFAIGGITAERLESLVSLGVKRVAVASAVTRAADPPRAARELMAALARLTVPAP